VHSNFFIALRDFVEVESKNIKISINIALIFYPKKSSFQFFAKRTRIYIPDSRCKTM
jgi:hypothetical protein